MTLTANLVHRVRQDLCAARIMTGIELMGLMHCSLRTVQRRVTRWCCHTSFNHNGRYYALPEVVQFDRYGIWEYHGVCFSRFGNLSRTVAGVVDEAEDGLAAAALAQRLRVNVHSFLSQFAARQVVTREKFGGLFRYFSTRPERAREQRHCYLTSTQSRGELVPLSDAAAVQLLLAWIENPGAEPVALSRTLGKRQVHATPEAVTQFLAEHNLDPKKKGEYPARY